MKALGEGVTVERAQKTLLIVVFVLVTLQLFVVASTPPASQYEVTIYDAFPAFFWLTFAVGFACCIVVLLLCSGDRPRSNIVVLGALLGVAMNGSILLLLGYLRGYYLEFGPGWDALTHIGEIKHVLSYGHTSLGNFYPILHVLGAEFSLSFGITAEFSGTIISPLFYCYFIIFIWTLSRSMRSGPGYLLIAFASPIIFSYFTRALQPFFLSLCVVPLLLHLWHERGSGRGIGMRSGLLMLVVALFITFFHPLAALIIALVFLAFGATGAVGRAFGHAGLGDRIQRDAAVNTALIILVVFTFWYLSFSSFLTNVQAVAYWLRGEAGVPLASAQFQLFSFASLTPAQAIYFTLSAYGGILIYTALGLFALASVLRRSVRADQVEPITAQYAIQLVTALLASMVMLFVVSIIREITRALAFTVLFSMILSALVYAPAFSNQAGSNPNPGKVWRTRVEAYMLTALILTVAVVGVYNSYESQRIFANNQEVTAADVSGFSWFFRHTNPSSTVITSTRVDRFEDLLVCFALETCPRIPTLPTPSHFGYGSGVSLGANLSSSGGYLITTEFDQYSSSSLPPELQSKKLYDVTPQDYATLAADPGVVEIYGNGGVQVWGVDM